MKSNLWVLRKPNPIVKEAERVQLLIVSEERVGLTGNHAFKSQASNMLHLVWNETHTPGRCALQLPSESSGHQLFKLMSGTFSKGLSRCQGA